MTEENTQPEITPEEAWAQYVAQHPPVKRHSYPLLIKIAALFMVLLTIYSLFLLPKYYGPAKAFTRAKKEYKTGDYERAYSDMAYVLNAGVYSPKTRTLMAKIMLKNFADADWEHADGLLDGLKFEDKDYKEITALIPPWVKQLNEDMDKKLPFETRKAAYEKYFADRLARMKASGKYGPEYTEAAEKRFKEYVDYFIEENAAPKEEK